MKNKFNKFIDFGSIADVDTRKKLADSIFETRRLPNQPDWRVSLCGREAL